MKWGCAFLACWLGVVSTAQAAGLIRDAEIESTLADMSAPLLRSAGLPPENVRIFIVNSPVINAFVAGGMNMFFHTGLILKAEAPEMLMGVMAHETGHIAGAHLSQLRTASEDASIGALISYVLGAAAILGGAGDAGGAIMSAGSNTSLRQLLSHYRGNEQQADQAGIRYMEDNGMSPRGMLDMFELLRRAERQHVGQDQDPYLRTHPLTTERIAAMRNAVDGTSAPQGGASDKIKRAHARMVAKLYAFLESKERTFRRWPESDTSEPALMAHAVAYFRDFQYDKAKEMADALLKLSPDAFTYDLKGQILYESGDLKGALEAYQNAAKLAPMNALILTDLGRTHVALKQDKDAILALTRAAGLANPSSDTQRQLAIAYGRSGQPGMASLSLAREAALNNKPDDMLRYAALAREQLPENSKARIQLDDLIEDARRMKAKQDKKDDLF
jgi:predicted Zn-dependent protease